MSSAPHLYNSQQFDLSLLTEETPPSLSCLLFLDHYFPLVAVSSLFRLCHSRRQDSRKLYSKWVRPFSFLFVTGRWNARKALFFTSFCIKVHNHGPHCISFWLYFPVRPQAPWIDGSVVVPISAIQPATLLRCNTGVQRRTRRNINTREHYLPVGIFIPNQYSAIHTWNLRSPEKLE